MTIMMIIRKKTTAISTPVLMEMITVMKLIYNDDDDEYDYNHDGDYNDDTNRNKTA